MLIPLTECLREYAKPEGTSARAQLYRRNALRVEVPVSRFQNSTDSLENGMCLSAAGLTGSTSVCKKIAAICIVVGVRPLAGHHWQNSRADLIRRRERIYHRARRQ